MSALFGMIRSYHLDEFKLARFLMRVEDGYSHNPYHSRWGDVLSIHENNAHALSSFTEKE